MTVNTIPQRFGLAAKFNALAILLVLLTSVSMSLFMIRTELTNDHQELLNYGIAIANASSRNCENAVYAEDARQLDQVAQGLVSDPKVAYVVISKIGGRVLASRAFRPTMAIPETRSVPAGDPARMRHDEVVSGQDGERYVEILYPIRRAQPTSSPHELMNGKGGEESDVIGQLRIGLSQQALRDNIRGLIAFTALLTLAIVAGGSALSVYLSRRITSPILRLKTAAAEISAGNFDSVVEVRTQDELSDLARAFNFMRDGLRKYRDQLLHDAFHDSLTGFPNRALFIDRLKHAMVVAKRKHGYQFGVLFLDLDGFKVVNESLGHEVGDELLAGVGKRLRSTTRPEDTIARLGSDEFGILLEDISGDGNAVFVTQRIRDAMAKPFHISGHEVFATCSAGIALSSRGLETAEQMLRDAETAMHQAKSRGRAHSVIFESGMHEHAVNRLQVEMDLRRAVERGEFVPYYQPIVTTHDRRVVGFEALARWNHPVRGMVSPGEFIQVAEETGIIVNIDRQVLRKACEQMKLWMDERKSAYLSFISVNLSNRQLLQNDLVEHIEQVIRETAIDPRCLKLEITENVIFDRPDAAVALLSRLRHLGVQLYIDDFGTGYSSLSYLHRLPINGLKIDRSFINRIGEPGESHAIIRTILTLAQDLRIDAIAEGVETEEQRAHIDSLQCRFAQGYLFSRPKASQEAFESIG